MNLSVLAAPADPVARIELLRAAPRNLAGRVVPFGAACKRAAAR
jgi:hypothetical protein